MTKKKTQDQKIYRYMSAKHAIQAIEQKGLRVSRLYELNDPFELMPALIDTNGVPQQFYEIALRNYIVALSQSSGIICFSAVLSDPVIWTHYADGHKGIALEFDRWSDDVLIKVEYSKERPTISVSSLLDDNEERQQNFDIMKEMVRTKAKSWCYEKEYRFFVELMNCQCRTGHYFFPIPENLLTGVFLGINCDIDIAYVECALIQSEFREVEVRKAIRSSTDFKLDF